MGYMKYMKCFKIAILKSSTQNMISCSQNIFNRPSWANMKATE